MREVIRTNDPVLVTFIDALLSEQNIGHLVLDTNMSIMEGSLGILPRRIMVDDSCFDRATRILREAGLEQELQSGPSPDQGDKCG